MAARKPLVIVAGQIEQIQSGDTLDATLIEIEQVTQTSGEAGGIVICTPVYCSAVDTVKKAKADASGTVQVVGLVKGAMTGIGTGTVQTSGVLAATTGQWDAVAGTTGGLAFGVVYYLSEATAGLMTATASDTVGKFVVRIGIALSTTELLINISEPILL